MRKIIALSVVSVLAACGSESTPAPTTVTGNINGVAFTQRDQAAFLGSGNSCALAVAPQPIGVSVAVAELTDYAGVCTATTTCSLKASSKTVTLIIARANIIGTTAPGFANGPYGFIDLAVIAGGGTPTLPNPDSGGGLPIFTAIVTELGATPTCTPTVVPVTAGALTVTGSSATSISGTVTLTLGGGAGTLTGGFSASTCGVPAFDACAALDGILGGTGGGLDFCGSQTPTCN